MPRIRSADEVSGESITINVTRENLQLKIDRMQDDAETDTTSYSTTLNVDFENKATRMAATDLATLILLVPGKLLQLKVSRAKLTGSLDPLAAAFSARCCDSLTKIHWNIRMSEYEENDYTPWGLAMLQMRRLQELEFGDICKVNNGIVSKVLTPLMLHREGDLPKIHASKFTVSPGSQELSDFASACHTSSSLKVLSIKIPPLAASYVAAIEEIIQKTSTLESLTVGFKGGDKEISLVGLAGALKHNNSLSTFRFGHGYTSSYFRPLREHETAAFLQVLSRHNYTLKSVSVLSRFGEKNPFLQEIEFYTSLNSVGRAVLMGTPTQRQTVSSERWFSALARGRNNVSIIYYLLKQNLTLFSPAVKTKRSKTRKQGLSYLGKTRFCTSCRMPLLLF